MDEVGVYCPFTESGQCEEDCTSNADRACVIGEVEEPE